MSVANFNSFGMMLAMPYCSEVFSIRLCSCSAIWAVVHFDQTECLASMNKAHVSRGARLRPN